MSLRRGRTALILAGLLTIGGPASAQGTSAPVVVEQSVARFIDPDFGGRNGTPRFVFERELIWASWLVAYEGNRTGVPNPPEERHISVALDRLVSEILLGGRPLDARSEARVEAATRAAIDNQTLAVGGPDRLAELRKRLGAGPAEAEGDEWLTILRRRARAELFLLSAVTDDLEPSETELRLEHARAPDVLARKPFDTVRESVIAYVRMLRLREAASAYTQAVRPRLHLTIANLQARDLRASL